MTPSNATNNNGNEQISRLIGRRAGNLFLTHQLWCSGAAMLALNQGLGGDLTQNQVARLAAGLGDGLGGAGCLCGGVSGAALALGLFLGHGRLSKDGDKIVLDTTRQLHDQFKEACGTTCCRILTKDQQRGSQEHMHLCAHRTTVAATLAAQLILQNKPELAQHADVDFLNRRETLIGARVKMIANRLSNKS